MIRVAVFLGVVLISVAVARMPRQNEPVPVLANRFLDSLTSDQLKQAARGFTDDERKHWQFVPAHREGLNLGQMTPKQAELAAELLKSSLSVAGLKKVETIKGLEDVLFEMENKNPGRDKKLYTFTFFGHPSVTEPWGWRYEGHHVSLNFTFKSGELVSSTPQFFGANPAEVRSGPQKGTRALAQEQDLAIHFIAEMTPEQRAKAMIGDVAPNEIVTSNQRKVAIKEAAGLAFKDLNSTQQFNLLKLLSVHAMSMSNRIFNQRWARVDRNTIIFGWMGSTAPGKGHYYRIQGSKFLVEYDNTQNDANHIHTVWRDFDGDFGEDVLAEHYAANRH